MSTTDFFKVGCLVCHIDEIDFIDTQDIENLELIIYFKTKFPMHVRGLDAIDLVMLVKPSLLEGKRLKFPKRMWIVHNLIAHPLMQILALIGFRKQALWLHDATIPRPLGKKDGI